MDLLNYFRECRGHQLELARKINAHPPDLSKWATRKRPVPIWRCMPIELATGGLVTRKDLRPNDWRSIWPDLAQQEKTHA